MARLHRRAGLLLTSENWAPPQLRAARFRHDDVLAGTVVAAIPDAHDPASTVTEQIMAGEAFQIDERDIYEVEHVLFSAHGPQADLLVIRGQETVGGETRDVRRAIQVRDLEAMLAQYRIDFPFGPTAAEWASIAGPGADEAIDDLN